MKVFTIVQVVRICKNFDPNITPRTVRKWLDSGRLKGDRAPGSQDWSISLEKLIEFLREHGMSLGGLEDGTVAKVLIVTSGMDMVDNINREMPESCLFKVAWATNGFDTGIRVESMRPDAVVVDFSIGYAEALQICQNLRRNPEFADLILVALMTDDERTMSVDWSIFNDSFKKPFDAAQLAKCLQTLIGAKKKLA